MKTLDQSPILTVSDAKADAKSWLFDHAAPLWSSVGVLSDGMFAERIRQDGTAASDMARRVRVQARQIYSFATIGALGWDGPWREVITVAIDKLLSKGRRNDGFFVHLFDAKGQLANDAVDLYDHAFMLFALGHAAKALGRPELLNIADDVRALMMQHWWRAEGGFWEGELVQSPPFRQNPHMHMFEAAGANFSAGGGRPWQDLSDRLAELFRNSFRDKTTGAVNEFFDRNWNVLEGDAGDLVEPGHCLEWAWLFEVSGEGNLDLAESLTQFARTHGIDHGRGVAINEVFRDGRVRDGRARLWPQTERLKAAVARFQRTGTEQEEAEVVAAYRGLKLYLDVPVYGVWRDMLNVDGTWVEEAAPASSFYHIVCAMNELLQAPA